MTADDKSTRRHPAETAHTRNLGIHAPSATRNGVGAGVGRGVGGGVGAGIAPGYATPVFGGATALAPAPPPPVEKSRAMASADAERLRRIISDLLGLCELCCCEDCARFVEEARLAVAPEGAAR